MICVKCGAEKSDDEFPLKSRASGKRHYRCKTCHQAYSKQHYINNMAYYAKKAKRSREAYRDSRRIALDELRVPCADCGTSHPAVLEFHHLDPSIKEGYVVAMSIKRMKIEAKKCVVLCANCHRIRHWEERLVNGERR